MSTDFFAHETAVIGDGASIGAGTKIWHFCHVMNSARLGRNCSLGQNVGISPGCVVGDNVKIQNNVSVYTGVVLEDDVFCGPSMVSTNVINSRSHIERKTEYKDILVKQGATIGANATVACGYTLGKFCFIGAGTVATRDAPDYGLVVGNPLVSGDMSVTAATSCQSRPTLTKSTCVNVNPVVGAIRCRMVS